MGGPLAKVRSRHYKSIFTDEQELLQALIDIHLNGDVELDPMYFKGNFYKSGINEPRLKFDIVPQVSEVKQADAQNLPLKDNSIGRMILDPPFMFGLHGNSGEFYSSVTHGIFTDFTALQKLYIGILREAMRLLKPKGLLIFKCQDYTDSKTTMTHCLVYKWATELGFYAKDVAILVKPNKVYNGNTTQRHLRKIHTYFWVFEKPRSLAPTNRTLT